MIVKERDVCGCGRCFNINLPESPCMAVETYWVLGRLKVWTFGGAAAQLEHCKATISCIELHIST
jgi:hypothetical protein